MNELEIKDISQIIEDLEKKIQYLEKLKDFLIGRNII